MDGPEQERQQHQALAATEQIEYKAIESDGEIEKLRLQIASLRSEKLELESKLDVCENERQELQKTSDGSIATIETYRSRMSDLVKANDSIVKEVQRARQEATKAKRRLNSNTEEMSAKLSALTNDLLAIKDTYEKDTSELKSALKESQKQRCDEQNAFRQAMSVQKEKFELEKKKLVEEATSIKKNSKRKIRQLLELLQRTHALREVELSQLESTISSMQNEKNNQILSLESEIEALRSVKQGSTRNVSAALDPNKLEQSLRENNDARARRSAQFDDCVQTFQALVTETCALPSTLDDGDIAKVMQQQERGQRMNDLIEVMNHLFRMEEDSQYDRIQNSMGLIEEYVALNEPDEAIVELRRQLAEERAENSILLGKLREQYCERCAVRDSARVLKR